MSIDATRLIGRQQELRQIGELVGRIRAQGGVLIVRGEAGIGKSALLAEASRAAARDGVRILATTGVQSEAQVPFAGLHRLLRPVLGHRDRLPPRQREALGCAFGEVEAVVPDLFLVALAALGLVSEYAVEAPVLLIVEDAHWLDEATAEALTFVARRLEFEPVVLLAGQTDGYPGPLGGGLPELRLERLPDDAAAALLTASAPGLPPATRERVLREAVGNPLALVELPAVLHETASVASPLSLTAKLERAFADRVDGLPAATRTVLTAAALDDGDGLAEILAAAAVLDGERPGRDSLMPAVRARLIEVDDDRLRFVHPLMRSAISGRAGAGDRHRAHAAFAQVILDDDRRVWHRAASVDGPDEQVASEMEAMALRVHRRAGTMTTVAALERAARLSETPARRGDRLLRAAEYAFELGRHEVTAELLGQAELLPLSPPQRWRLAWTRDSFDEGVVSRGMDARSLVTVAARAAGDDPGLALKLLYSAALRGWWTGPRPEVSAEIVAAAERLPPGVDDPHLVATLAFAAPIDRGAKVIDRLAEAGDDVHTSRMLGVAAMAVGALDIAMRLLGRAVADLRAQGRLGLLARTLAVQAWTAALIADVDVALPAADEARRLARETSQPVFGATAAMARALLAAIRDEQDVVDAFAGEAERVAAPAGARCLLAGAQLARGMAALGAGGGRRVRLAEPAVRPGRPGLPPGDALLRRRRPGRGGGPRGPDWLGRPHDGRDGGGGRQHAVARPAPRTSPRAGAADLGRGAVYRGLDHRLGDLAVSPGARPARVRGVAPTRAAGGRVPRAPAGGPRDVRRAGRGRLGRPRPAGTAGLGRDQPAPRAPGPGQPHGSGAADRPDGGGRADQPRDRSAPLPVAPDHRLAPAPGVSQARGRLPGPVAHRAPVGRVTSA